MIDSHAHLQDEAFADDLSGVVERAAASGISHIICVGYDLPSSRLAVELAEGDERILAAVGIHPHAARECSEEILACLLEMAKSPRVVAIGEIGLDYHYDADFKEAQFEAFRAQIRLAQEAGKPVIIHDREAHQDVLNIVTQMRGAVNGGVMHCYSGSLPMAREFIELGFMISLAGPVTFKNARKSQEVAAGVDMTRLLVETDCPYLSPEPYRGKRNEPVRVWEVAQKIAEIRGASLGEIEKATDRNCRELFGF